jgi:hypothetical protein
LYENVSLPWAGMSSKWNRISDGLNYPWVQYRVQTPFPHHHPFCYRSAQSHQFQFSLMQQLYFNDNAFSEVAGLCFVVHYHTQKNVERASKERTL